MEALATAAHGFVGADLAALVNEAAMSALRRHISRTRSQKAEVLSETSTMSAPSTQSLKGSSPQEESGLVVGVEDFAVAETRVGPSAMREVALEVGFSCVTVLSDSLKQDCLMVKCPKTGRIRKIAHLINGANQSILCPKAKFPHEDILILGPNQPFMPHARFDMLTTSQLYRKQEP